MHILLLYTYTLMHSYTHTLIHLYTCTLIHLYTYILTHLHTYTLIPYTHTHLYTCTSTPRLYEVPDWFTPGTEDIDLGYISPILPLTGTLVYGQLIANVIGTLYNVSYVILINLVLSSIVSGLIIDTFSR
jgi:hypothetical protein